MRALDPPLCGRLLSRHRPAKGFLRGLSTQFRSPLSEIRIPIMRARAGDPPRTMAQKILAGRCADPSLSSSFVEVKVDQIVLARAPMRGLAEGLQAGLKKTSAEVAIAYDGLC